MIEPECVWLASSSFFASPKSVILGTILVAFVMSFTAVTVVLFGILAAYAAVTGS